MATGAQALTRAVLDLKWNHGPLDGAIVRAFRPSVMQAVVVANTRALERFHTMPDSGKPRAGARARNIQDASIKTASATLSPTGLGTVFEVGRKGGYPISPRGGGLRRTKSKFATAENAAFVSEGRLYNVGRRKGGKMALYGKGWPHPVTKVILGGSMAPIPYLQPAAEFWATVIFPTQARRVLAAAGFRVARAFGAAA
jgi:hypothetical protein